MDKLFMNNLVKLTGMIISEPVFDHESNGEKFYRAFLEVKRLSDTEDVIPLLISERGFDLDDIVGKRVDVVGQFRSHNHHDGEKKMQTKLFLMDMLPKNQSIAKLQKVERLRIFCLL